MRNVEKTAPAKRTRLSAEERRASILQAATEVFTYAGYRAGKVSEVAAMVGVTEPVIFQNFGTKTALFAAVLDRLARQINAEMDAFAGHHDSAASVLAHILSPPRGRSPHDQGSPHMLFADAAALIAEPGAGEAAGRVARVIAGHIAELIRRGQADGDLDAGADPEAAAWLVLSVLATRSLRAAGMHSPRLREPAVAALALRCLVQACPPSVPAEHQALPLCNQ